MTVYDPTLSTMLMMPFICTYVYDHYISKEELEENGFVNMFLKYAGSNLEDCYYLLFETKKIKPYFIKKLQDWYECKDYVDKVIKKKIYTLYVLKKLPCRSNFYARFESIIKWKMWKALPYEDKMKILEFWKCKPTDKLHAYLFSDTINPPIETTELIV